MAQEHIRVEAKPAATVILLRDGAEGIEVFMLRRTESANFAAGMYVFPGGRVDDADRDTQWGLRCHGLSDAGGHGHAGLADDGLPYMVAVVRECFEEAGLLLAREHDDTNAPLIDLHDARNATRYAQLRDELNAGKLGFNALCRDQALRLAADHMAYLTRWITPVGQPRRFDTRFFIAAVPAQQTGSHDNQETTDHVWVRPADALARFEARELNLMHPTRYCLRYLLDFKHAAAAIREARHQNTIPLFRPRLARTPKGMGAYREYDPQYAEIAKLDPGETATAWGAIVPGMVIRLSPTIERVTAPNPGIMTGPGTNSYLIGRDTQIGVLDPGPADPAHIASLLEAIGTRTVGWILITHTHLDHSPAAALLQAALAARQAEVPRVIGLPAPVGQDASFVPQHRPAHGESIDIGGVALTALHTPGHASNHICWLHEGEHLLFTGDHIMQGSTVVINPPDGDMGAYLDSLRALRARAERIKLEWLAPAHGFLIEQPVRAIDRLIAHRLKRENKVLDALGSQPAATIAQLLPVVYDDVPAGRSAWASRSLLAHLQKLRHDGRAIETDAGWIKVEDA